MASARETAATTTEVEESEAPPRAEGAGEQGFAEREPQRRAAAGGRAPAAREAPLRAAAGEGAPAAREAGGSGRRRRRAGTGTRESLPAVGWSRGSTIVVSPPRVALNGDCHRPRRPARRQCLALRCSHGNDYQGEQALLPVQRMRLDGGQVGGSLRGVPGVGNGRGGRRRGRGPCHACHERPHAGDSDPPGVTRRDDEDSDGGG